MVLRFHCNLIINFIDERTLGSKTYRVRKADISFFGSNTSDEEYNSSDSLSEADVVAMWHNMEFCSMYYPLWSRPKGYFLIINIYTVKGQKPRLGTHWDAFRLVRTFKKLGLVVRLYIIVCLFLVFLCIA